MPPPAVEVKRVAVKGASTADSAHGEQRILGENTQRRRVSDVTDWLQQRAHDRRRASEAKGAKAETRMPEEAEDDKHMRVGERATARAAKLEDELAGWPSGATPRGDTSTPAEASGTHPILG